MSSYLEGSSSSSKSVVGGEEAGEGWGVEGEEEKGGRITDDRSSHLKRTNINI